MFKGQSSVDHNINLLSPSLYSHLDLLQPGGQRELPAGEPCSHSCYGYTLSFIPTIITLSRFLVQKKQDDAIATLDLRIARLWCLVSLRLPLFL